MDPREDSVSIVSTQSPEVIANTPIPVSWTLEDSIVAARIDTQTILDGIGPTDLATLGKLHTLAEPLVVRCCLSFLKRNVRLLVPGGRPDCRENAVTIDDITYRFVGGQRPCEWRTLIILLVTAGLPSELPYRGHERRIEAVPQFDKAVMGVPPSAIGFDTTAALRIVKNILETSYTWINARLTSAVSRSTGQLGARLYRRLGEAATRLNQDPQIIDEFLFAGEDQDGRVLHLLSKEKIQQSIARIAANAGTAQYSPTRLATEFAQCAVQLGVAHARFIPGELQSVNRSFLQTDYKESDPGLFEAELAHHRSLDFSLIGINWTTGPRLWLLSPQKTVAAATSLVKRTASNLVRDFLDCYDDLARNRKSDSGSVIDDDSHHRDEPAQGIVRSLRPPLSGWQIESCEIPPVHQQMAAPITPTSLCRLPLIILTSTRDKGQGRADRASDEKHTIRSVEQAIMKNEGREWFTSRRLAEVFGRSKAQVRSKLDRKRRKHLEESRGELDWRRRIESSYEVPSRAPRRPTWEYDILSIWRDISTLPERS